MEAAARSLTSNLKQVPRYAHYEDTSDTLKVERVQVPRHGFVLFTEKRREEIAEALVAFLRYVCQAKSAYCRTTSPPQHSRRSRLLVLE